MTTRLTMPQEVTRRATPGELLKRPRERATRKVPQRKGRIADPSYLVMVRQLPCIACGCDVGVQAAHIRMNSAAHGKRQAMGQKPDDKWCLPLCDEHHREQHRVGELQFWFDLDTSPLLVCERLQRAAPDLVAMRDVVFKAIAERA